MTTSFARSLMGMFVLSLALLPTIAVAEDDAGTAVYKAGLKSACFVYVPKQGSGSGSLIDKEKRLILTNNHVVGNADYVIVLFPMNDSKGKLIVEMDKYKQKLTSNNGIRGKVLVREETRDLAVVQLDKLPPGVKAVKFASGSPETGENIHSIGNPGASDAAWVYTPGKVRTVYDKTWTAGSGTSLSNHKAKIIEATSPTSPGDSGGPLFNSKGEQIGVTQGGRVSLSAQGYAYFIDVTSVKSFLKDRKIVLSAPKDEADSESSSELVAQPKTDSDKPATPKKEPKKEVVKVDPSVAEQEAVEKRATTEFALLRGLTRDPNKRELAIEKLQALIKKYPSTNAAKEAKELVRKLEQ